MNIDKVSVFDAASHAEKAFYALLGEQTSISKTNNDVQRELNERMKETLASYAAWLNVFDYMNDWAKLSKLLGCDDTTAYLVGIGQQALSVVGVALGVTSAICMLSGQSTLAAIFGALDGLFIIGQGGLQIAGNIAKAESAEYKGNMDGDSATCAYLQDRSDSIASKTGDAYKTLSSLTRAFNEQLKATCDAEIKAIKR